MKKFTILLLIFISITSKSQDYNTRIYKFNHFLGYEKSNVLDSAVYSMDLFLKNNFNNYKNQKKRIKEFLKYINDNGLIIDSNWTFTSDLNKRILTNYETSGLRKEIYIKNNEEYNSEYNMNDMWKFYYDELYDTINVDTVSQVQIKEEIIPITRNGEIYEPEPNIESFDFNIYGKYLYGLWKYNQEDKYIIDYVHVKILAGDISLNLMINSFLQFLKPKDYLNPFIKRIIAIELYLYLIKNEIEKSSAPNIK